MTCNVISPQLMWFKKIRRNLVITFILSIIVNIGMWFERFVIIVTSLHRDYITSSWTQFHPTYVDMGVFLGTIGLFFVLFLLYSRTFPVLALNEVKTILRATGEYGVKGASSHSHDDHATEVVVEETTAPVAEEEPAVEEAPAVEESTQEEASDDSSENEEKGDNEENKEQE